MPSTCFGSTPEVSVKVPTVFDHEIKVLSYSGLELNKDLFVYEVPIEIDGKSYNIHTYRCGDDNKEDLVLLHGYGGSSALYYTMIADLSKHFRVFCIDFIGMALSTHEQFDLQTPQETVDFMVNSVEKWRKAVQLETFHLAGHSFGGYIACHYTLANQERVKRLHLLSPLGMTKYENDGPTLEDVKKRVGFWKSLGFRIMLKLFKGVFESKKSLHEMVRNNPKFAKYMVKNYVSKRFGMKNKEEAEAVKNYLLAMLSMPEGSEKVIFNIIKPPYGGCHSPLEEIVEERLQMPVDCYFGDTDYMDNLGGKRIAERGVKKNYTLKIVPKAQHQVTMQNPKFLSEEIIKGLTVSVVEVTV